MPGRRRGVRIERAAEFVSTVSRPWERITRNSRRLQTPYCPTGPLCSRSQLLVLVSDRTRRARLVSSLSQGISVHLPTTLYRLASSYNTFHIAVSIPSCCVNKQHISSCAPAYYLVPPALALLSSYSLPVCCLFIFNSDISAAYTISPASLNHA